MRRVRGSTPGLLLGTFGCAFGVLGILSFGLLFTPIAAFFSLLGLLLAIGGLSPTGMLVSLVGCFLTVAGFVVSPSLWILAAGLSGVSVPAKDWKEPEPIQEPVPLPLSR